MFSGIVQRTLSIQSLEKKTGLWTLSITLPKEMLEGLTLGASIALNGTCLTVCKIEGCNVWFDVMMATLSVTNLFDLRVGSAVNVERAARFGDDIGGHQLSGHVFGQTSIVEIERPENNRIIWFDIPAQFKAYIFDKGYIGLNGCSLTIAKVEETRFCVYLIPETLSITTFGELDVGANINLEVDSHTQAVVDTVERMLLQRGLIK
jgi:riboflavin synthase